MVLLFILVSRFSQLTSSVKLVPLEPHTLKYLLTKTAKAHIFSTVNHKEKFLSAADRSPKFGHTANRKPYTWSLKIYSYFRSGSSVIKIYFNWITVSEDLKFDIWPYKIKLNIFNQSLNICSYNNHAQFWCFYSSSSLKIINQKLLVAP